MNEEQARERIKELRDFYTHITVYVAVNAFLLAVNLLTGTDVWWFLFPLMGWGIAIVIHAFTVIGTGHKWEQRKLEELTGLKATRDEIQQLAERTDSLVTILSSVNWEKIDPELLDTRKNLDSARAKIAELKQRSDPASQAELAREIKKLEAFVTSPKFEYYDMAAGNKAPN